MKNSDFPNKVVGAVIIILAILSLLASIGFSVFAQLQMVGVPLEEKSLNWLSSFVFIVGVIAVIVILIEKYTNLVFPRDLLLRIFIPLVAIFGSLHSFLFIYYNMGNSQFEFFRINNHTNFMSLYFFAIYSLMYSGFITDWWNNLKNLILKWIMLILIEVPNFISWWVLAFSVPLMYIEEINSSVHFWFTFFFAWCVVLLLMGIRLVKSK